MTSDFRFSQIGQNFESILNDPREINSGDWWFLKFFEQTPEKFLSPIKSVTSTDDSKEIYDKYLQNISKVSINNIYF